MGIVVKIFRVSTKRFHTKQSNENERTKTVRYKTATSNNCFNKPAGREVSFVQQTKNKIVTAAVESAYCELANRG